jgi:hypothetical protein
MLLNSRHPDGTSITTANRKRYVDTDPTMWVYLGPIPDKFQGMVRYTSEKGCAFKHTDHDLWVDRRSRRPHAKQGPPPLESPL